MSVVAITSRSNRRAASANRTIEREETEFQGFWLNIGVRLKDGTFARLSRGVAVDDLRTGQIYDTTDPGYAQQVAFMNTVTETIRKMSDKRKVAAGEAIELPLLEVILYRKKEGTDGVQATMKLDDMEALLTGRAELAEEEEASEPDPVPTAKSKTKQAVAEIEGDDDDNFLTTRKAK